VRQATPAGFALVILDGDAECTGLADHDHEFAASGDGGVEEVSLEQDVLLDGEGDDDGWELGALGLVHGHGVGGDDLVEFAEVVDHRASIEVDGEFLFEFIKGGDPADVAVEDVLVVVVAGLQDLVAAAEPDPEFLDPRDAFGWGIEGFLEDVVEFADAEGAAVLRSEDLDVADGIEFEPGGDPVADDLEERAGDGSGILAFDEVEVGEVGAGMGFG